jgi:hypothetical protein
MFFFFHVRISHALRFISICDPFTDSPSWLGENSHMPLPGFLTDYSTVAVEPMFLQNVGLSLNYRASQTKTQYTSLIIYSFP